MSKICLAGKFFLTYFDMDANLSGSVKYLTNNGRMNHDVNDTHSVTDIILCTVLFYLEFRVIDHYH